MFNKTTPSLFLLSLILVSLFGFVTLVNAALPEDYEECTVRDDCRADRNPGPNSGPLYCVEAYKCTLAGNCVFKVPADPTSPCTPQAPAPVSCNSGSTECSDCVDQGNDGACDTQYHCPNTNTTSNTQDYFPKAPNCVDENDDSELTNAASYPVHIKVHSNWIPNNTAQFAFSIKKLTGQGGVPQQNMTFNSFTTSVNAWWPYVWDVTGPFLGEGTYRITPNYNVLPINDGPDVYDDGFTLDGLDQYSQGTFDKLEWYLSYPTTTPTPTPTGFTPTPTPTPSGLGKPNYITQGLASSVAGGGQIVVGNQVSFSATVRNAGPVASFVSSYTRVRLDVDNNLIWDVTTPTNPTTTALGAGATEVETWNNFWTATGGTHRFEICADITNLIDESDETDNCTEQIFNVAIPAPTPVPSQTPDAQNVSVEMVPYCGLTAPGVWVHWQFFDPNR